MSGGSYTQAPVAKTKQETKNKKKREPEPTTKFSFLLCCNNSKMEGSVLTKLDEHGYEQRSSFSWFDLVKEKGTCPK